MPHTVRNLMEQQVALLFAGRVAEMLPVFDLPLALQVSGDMLVLPTPQRFIDAMAAHQEALVAAGVTGLSPRLVAVELPRRARFRFWMEIDHLRGEVVDRAADRMIIYCRQDAGKIQVELIDVRKLAIGAEAPALGARSA